MKKINLYKLFLLCVILAVIIYLLLQFFPIRTVVHIVIVFTITVTTGEIIRYVMIKRKNNTR